MKYKIIYLKAVTLQPFQWNIGVKLNLFGQVLTFYQKMQKVFVFHVDDDAVNE